MKMRSTSLRRRQDRLRDAALVAMSTLILVACGDATKQTTVTSPEAAVGDRTGWGPLAVVSAEQGGDGALIEGVLNIDDACVLLDERGDDVLLIWPDELTTWDGESQTIMFESASGEVVAFHDGDQVSFGGGGSSLAEDGRSSEEFVGSIEWVSEPKARCLVGTRWFINELAP